LAKPRVAKINENGKQDTRPIKYTRAFVLSELKSMLLQARSNKDIFLLGDLFESRDYHTNRFSEWREKWLDDTEISGLFSRLKSIFEYRLNKAGLLGITNSTLTILNLKHHYDWKDKTEVDQNITMRPEDWLDKVMR
jgi:hypothetical protein